LSTCIPCAFGVELRQSSVGQYAPLVGGTAGTLAGATVAKGLEQLASNTANMQTSPKN
jgi:hypothetical protein